MGVMLQACVASTWDGRHDVRIELVLSIARVGASLDLSLSSLAR